jgi:hypothetical protein
MLSLIPARQVQFDPDLLERNQYEPHVHRSLIATPLRENEFVILKDGVEANDWYCAQIVKVLPTHVIVHYYTTESGPLLNYANTNRTEREYNITQAVFLKTWCLPGSRGYATTISPEGVSKTRDIWSGTIKVSDLNDHLLIRNVGLQDDGKLSSATVVLVSKLKYPHHQGP